MSADLSPQPVLRAVDAVRKYQDVVAVSGLNLEVRSGEVVCLLGANGAGKTTSLNLFLGFVKPTSGTIEAFGVDVARAPNEARRHLGYLPEVVQLYPTLSGVETLGYFAALSDRKQPGDLRALLRSVGLADETHLRRVSTYSKGMRQKLGLALALSKGARALLLDEPLSGLDPVAANELVRLLLRLSESGTAILIVTHDIFRAHQLRGRIGIMRHGRLTQTLSASEISAHDLEQLYINNLRDLE